MKCPRCDAQLTAKKANNKLDVHVCTECTGTLVAQNRLVALLEMIAQPLRHVVDVDEPIEPISDHEQPSRCPRCRSTMESFGYMGTKLVTADRCSPCAVIWTDPEELGTMALLYLRTNKRTLARDEKTRKFGQELADRTHNQLRARAHADRIATGLLTLRPT